MEIFGPVKSRRFGMSLGINHLPPKLCSYGCVYCQLGRTNRMRIAPAAYSQPGEILQAVQAHLDELKTPPDYLTFVSNGEPSLDINLGEAIDGLKKLGIKIAVISNASLLWLPEVRARLAQADAVSVKIDALDEETWRRVNRPHGKLKLAQILAGLRTFAQAYPGRLLSETMLVRDLNTAPEQLRACAVFIAEINPEMAYLALPLRAPAESWVEAPSAQEQEAALRVFTQVFSRSALLGDLPPTNLAESSDPLNALLETIKVHPMEREEVLAYLKKHAIPADVLDELIRRGRVRASDYREKTFYAALYS